MQVFANTGDMRHNSKLMKKFVALLVLVLLPLQLAFAAGAEYCETAKADDGQHFGHHGHKLGKSKVGVESKKSGGEPDCGFCQLGCAQTQVSSFDIQVFPLTAQHNFADGPLPSGFSPPIFDRPPRLSLA